jgi:formate-dependent nitrite reductase membrane component NrfD
MMAGLNPWAEVSEGLVGLLSIIFLSATGVLLVMDLDQPKRFLYVLLRPQWTSWLAKGAYAITLFGGLVATWLVASWLGARMVADVAFFTSAVLAVVVAAYTAFLFAQAKGRDFWQSPSLILHMVTHSIMAGASILLLAQWATSASAQWESLNRMLLTGSILFNLTLMLIELTVTHPTEDAKTAVSMIISGRYKRAFWMGAIVLGNVVPLIALWIDLNTLLLAPLAVLAGIFITEKIWVEAPQRIPLT